MNSYKMLMAWAAVRKEWKLRGTIVIRNLLGTHGNLADGRASGGNYSHLHLLERNDRSGESVNVGNEIGALHV